MQSVSEEEEENGRVAECHRGAGVLHGVLAVTVVVAAAVRPLDCVQNAAPIN